MVTARAVNHTALSITDEEKSRHFYEKVLGLAILPRPNFGVGGFWFGAGKNQIHLIAAPKRKDGRPDPTGPHVAIEVEDFEAAKARLREMNVPFVEPKDFGIDVQVGNQLWIQDPDGNTIELIRPPK
jgi:glyoxylase I family protein